MPTADRELAESPSREYGVVVPPRTGGRDGRGAGAGARTPEHAGVGKARARACGTRAMRRRARAISFTASRHRLSLCHTSPLSDWATEPGPCIGHRASASRVRLRRGDGVVTAATPCAAANKSVVGVSRGATGNGCRCARGDCCNCEDGGNFSCSQLANVTGIWDAIEVYLTDANPLQMSHAKACSLDELAHLVEFALVDAHLHLCEPAIL
mmetsp:Transcript_29702/g.79779  ORF Transcript_29702/g.79779 Transcript_29702/m.79779 type:complete len:211 (-) Transcript_29702:603-1235(-)